MKKTFKYLSIISLLSYIVSLILVINFSIQNDDGTVIYSQVGVILNFVFFICFVSFFISYIVLLIRDKFKPITSNTNDNIFNDNSFIEKVSNYKIDLITYITSSIKNNKRQVYEFSISLLITVVISIYMFIFKQLNTIIYPILILDILLFVILSTIILIKPIIEYKKQIDNKELIIYKDRISLGDNSALDDFYLNMCHSVIVSKKSIILTFYYKGNKRIILMKEYLSKECYQYLISKLKYIQK